jgi:response regulator RpfG family c-di-GMP phosphodiesterase
MDMKASAERWPERIGECLLDTQGLSEQGSAHSRPGTWKIIVADDEDEVHAMTRLVLSDYFFEGRGLNFLNAYSGADCLRLMRQHPDTAAILLDVVMESDDAGLQVARQIREDLANPFVRIILRTGQPGKAPETRVISTFDINDYKEKTELTAQKLFTTITAALRSYRDMRTIEMNRRGLEKIIDASASLFEVQSLCKFAEGVLIQLVSIFQLGDHTDVFLGSAFTASQRDSNSVIIAGMGRYEGCIGKTVQETAPPEVMLHLNRAITERRSHFAEDGYVGFFTTQKGSQHLLYLKGCRHLTEMEKSLISIFSSNVAIAFENIALNQEIIDTQKEVIFTLGEVIEVRSKETGNHVRRVAELCYLLALKFGLGQERAELVRLASPMHDIGKVGIPDGILLKPGRLTPEEFEIIQRHSETGFHLLKNSRREILEAAAISARQHHERWDGRGYPEGLKGEQIHIFGRITALADVFDALMHVRVYKSAWGADRVIAYIAAERGKQFDPGLVDVFLENRLEFLAIDEAFPDEMPSR